jgi:hypothetical protein
VTNSCLNRSISTLYIEKSNSEYIDPSFYEEATRTNNLKRIDYLLSRVTHTHGYSDSLLKEIFSSFNPHLNKVSMLPNVEHVNYTNQDTGENKHLIVSTPVALVSQDTELLFEKTVEAVINLIDNQEPDLIPYLLRCFSFYIVQCNLETNNILLESDIAYFQNIKFLNFSHLCQYIGSRSLAERSRKLFREIFASVAL